MTQAISMHTRAIPVSGELLPVIGLGTWQTLDVPQEPELLDRLEQIPGLLLAGGGKLIDSSPMYGRAEAVVGELLGRLGSRERTFLATKVWTTGREAGVAQMRRSAQLLRSATIDLIQIHNLLDWRTHLATLRRMKEAGAIRYLGITHYTAAALPDLAAIIEREPIDFVQLEYSISARQAERRMLPLAAERKVAVIANRPFAGGSLWRLLRGRPVPGWAGEFDCVSWSQFFLKFIVSHPAVTCVIPATANPTHLSDNLKAGYGRLPDMEQRRRMAEFWEQI